MNLIKNIKFTEFARSSDVLIEGVYTDENEEYLVELHRILNNHPFEYRLAIKRTDKQPIHSWPLFQEIKDQIAGEDVVAIEIYPEKSKVTDTANMYHLWVFEKGYGPRVGLIAPESEKA